jgi:predicted dehydrogenase
VGDSGLVQVAEQYPHYPSHAARLALVRSGVLGIPTQVQVSSTQLYHAVALMRAHLDVRPGPATVTATTTSAPLLQPLSRAGWAADPQPTRATTTHAVIRFGGPDDGLSGVYDFTDLQTRNLLRVRRLVVRGTHGELDGEQLVRWGGPETVLTSRIERRQSGHDLDMSGYDSETLSHGDQVLWRNPWPGRRWSDDEHATASMLAQMATWVSGSAPESGSSGPYPLAEASQDAAIGFAIEESVRRAAPVTLDDQPWW